MTSNLLGLHLKLQTKYVSLLLNSYHLKTNLLIICVCFLLAMRSDRKRLKSEKIELLNQAKELYSTIESKENELRDFLRHYESKTKETSFAVKKVKLQHYFYSFKNLNL